MTSPAPSPSDFTAADELRNSVKQGLEERFFAALSVFDSDRDRLNQIANEKYTINTVQETRLLIEATKYGRLNILKHLLAKCNINVNATGNIKCYGTLVNGVTALWLASVYGNLEIVKVLIDYGATVDYNCTGTVSTPLRAACHFGRVKVVKHLIRHGANVEVINDFNCTCLMIACNEGHFDIVKLLLENGADINRQTKYGFTAMHYSALNNHFNIVVLLLKFNAQQLKNDQNLTPILVAAERSHYVLVNYLSEKLNLARKEIIDAKELLGASLLAGRHDNLKEMGFKFLLCSMKMRYNENPVILKKVYKTIEAYDNQIECQTVEGLMNIKNNMSALIYESLIIRERILGDTNEDILLTIICCGDDYAQSINYIPCLKLWNHALNIAQKNQFGIYKKIIIRFVEVFFKMIKYNVTIDLSDLQSLLKILIEKLQSNQNKILTAFSKEEKRKMEETFFVNIYLTLGVIIIISIVVLPQYKNSENPLVKNILYMILKLNKLNLRTKNGQTLLHVCLQYAKRSGRVFEPRICSFPNFSAMKLLIFCGANVNAVDLNNNTPLHCIGKYIKCFSHLPHGSDNSNTMKIVMELLNNGAHTDCVNKDGECPHTGYLKNLFHLTDKTPLSLKCLSARVLNNQVPKGWYHNHLPLSLQDFTNLH